MFDFIRKHLKKSSVVRSVLTLLTGTTIAQIIPLVISPLITRLYTPENFGVLALFVSLTSILGAISNARYEIAVVLPEDEKDSCHLIVLCLFIALVFSVITWIAFKVFRVKILVMLQNEEIAFWLNFVPLVVLIIGIDNPLRFYNIRKKLYSNIAKSSIAKAALLATVQIAAGFLLVGSTGLIIGRFVFRMAGSLVLAKPFFIDKKKYGKTRASEVIRMARRYSRFFKYAVWARLANTTALRLNNILIANLFSVTDIGFYSLTMRVLGRPDTLLARSIGQVFYQRATEEKHKHGHARRTFNNSLFALMIIGFVVYLALYFSVESIFPFVFGKKWQGAGTYAKILMPLFFIRFIVSPLSNTTNVFEKQHITLLWQTGLLLFTLLTYFIADWFNFDINQFLYLYTYLHVIHYTLLGIITFKISRGT
ncbi:MAG: lipopolysaccharide biosynthesis protein [Atribacterota bacterium]